MSDKGLLILDVGAVSSNYIYGGKQDNEIILWSVGVEQSEEDVEEPTMSKSSSISHVGDVMGLDYKGGIAAAASSNGSVSMYKLDKMSSSTGLEPLHSWSALHSFKSGRKCPCTDLCIEDNIATCGEDGSIHILDMTRPTPVRSLVSCDSCTLNSIIWVSPQSVAVVNTSGQLKVFDIRQSGTQPIQKFILSSADFSSLNCLDKHPSQHHLVATGSYNGVLGIYDLRQDGVPVTILEGHSGNSISDIKFHCRSPDMLFTSAYDGTVWQWNGGKPHQGAGDSGEQSVWFLADAVKHRIEVSELTSLYTQAGSMSGYPVNCLDVCNNMLVCGGDNGALHLFYDLHI